MKTPINFLCRRELNFRSLIQPQDTLPIKLTETHTYNQRFEHTNYGRPYLVSCYHYIMKSSMGISFSAIWSKNCYPYISLPIKWCASIPLPSLKPTSIPSFFQINKFKMIIK